MTSPAPFDPTVIQKPDAVCFDAFTIAGPSCRFDEETKAAIPQFWSKLIGALPFAGQVPGWTTYGVISNANRVAGSFDYMAGVRIMPGANPPAGFATIVIPAAKYAVFRITLGGGAPHPQLKAAMARIWSELVPASGLLVAASPYFELYDGDFAPDRPGAWIDFHLPVDER